MKKLKDHYKLAIIIALAVAVIMTAVYTTNSGHEKECVVKLGNVCMGERQK